MPVQPPEPPKPPKPPTKVASKTAQYLYSIELRVYELQLQVDELIKATKVQ